MSDKFEMVNADLGADINCEVEAFVHEQLEWLEQAHKELHLNKLPKWRKLYLGVPAEMTRNFPFPNAANTIVQVIGETTDAMVARVMGLLYATHPLWPFKNYAKAKTDDEKKAGEIKRQTIEDFMDLVGFEPSMLNLQEAESLWYTDAAKLGTAFLKLGLEDVQEAVVVGYSEKKIKAKATTIYSGPTVTKLRHEDVFADPKAQSLDKSGFVAVRRTLNRQQLEERGFTGAYTQEAVDAIIASPDRSIPREQVRTELQDQGIQSPNRPESTAEWDVYECYFGWWAGSPKRKFRLIYTYHKKSKTVMRRVFNFLPKNDLPVKRAKLGYRTDGMYGHGYAELLETYQEELSATHNQRLDNATVANIRALRVSPRARALDANMELYPSAILIGDKDEIESIAVGDVYPSTFKNEEMTLQLVARRSGITPAVSGSGAGGPMKGKQQQYSAQGTLAVMQENNSVVGFATAEFRHAHVMLGSALASMYGKFGTNGIEAAFGLDAEFLDQALKEFEEGNMRLPIRAATGSLNKEVDKQTGMLMAGVLQRHYTAVGQTLQALSNPMVPPMSKDYFTHLIVASEMFHKKLLKDFGYDQPDLYIPDAQTQPPPQQGAGGSPSQGAPMGGTAQGQPGAGGAPVPQPGMGGPQGGIAPMAGASTGPR